MWWGTVNFIFYTWQHNVKGQLILILKSAASRPVVPFHEVKEIISESILKTDPYYLLCKVQSEDIIRVFYECTVRNDYFSFLIGSNHIIESAGLCAPGEKLYYVQWLIIKRCLIPLRHTVKSWRGSQGEDGKHHLHQHGAYLGFHTLYHWIQKNSDVRYRLKDMKMFLRPVIHWRAIQRTIGVRYRSTEFIVFILVNFLIWYLRWQPTG